MLELVGIIVGIIAGASVVLFGSRGLVDFIRGASERRRLHTEVSSGDRAQTSGVDSQTGTAGTIEMRPTRLAETQPTSTGGVFIGRQRELRELTAALENSLAGHGRVVMLAGEPGIGKTRTAQELASYARSSSAEVVWGRSYQETGTPPLWPWIEVTRSLVRGRDAEKLRAEMGPGAADIAELLPDLKTKLPDLQTRPELEPEQASFRLYDSMTTFLVNEAQSKPLLLVLEDLHWADSSSLRMLEFLGGHIGDSPLLVVGTYRDVELSPEHPLTETLANLSHERNFRLETLRRFSEEQTGDLIEATGGRRPSPALVQRIQGHTEGNPLFVIEVVRLLAERGQRDANGDSPGDEFAVPEGVRAVTRQRLRRLSALCNQGLSTASIVGREFDFGLLHRLIEGTTEEDLSGALEQAVNVRLVEELPRQPGRFQFSHSLVQQAAAEELSAARRMRLHARIAEALEAYYGEHTDAHAAELAHHFAEAQTVLGTEKLVRYSLMAGERALAGYAHEEALALFQRGLAAKEGHEMDAETAALLFGLVRAQAATLETHEQGDAVVNLVRAFDYYADAGEVDRAVAVAEYPLYTPSFRLPGVPQLVSRALEMVAPESHAAGHLQSRYGWFMGMEQGDYAGALAAFARAMAIAQRENDPRLEMRTLANAAEVEGYYNHGEESLQCGLQAVALAGMADDPDAELLARYWISFRQLTVGETGAASLHTAAMLGLADRLRHRFYWGRSLFMNEALSRHKGEWQAARDFSDRGLRLSPRDPRLLAARLALEFETGNVSEGDTHLGRLLETARLTPPGPNNSYALAALMVPAVSRITGAINRMDQAESFTQAVLSSPSVTPVMGMMARMGAALTAVLRGDVTAAKEHYPVLRSQWGTVMVFLIAGDRLLGLLAQTMGQFDVASGHFEDALTFCRKAGYRPELAWSCCDYADALLQRKGDDTRVKAMTLLNESLAISSELGMRPLMERALERRKRLTG